MQESIGDRIEEFEDTLAEFKSELDVLKGKRDLLDQQIHNSKAKVIELKKQIRICKSGVEIMGLVQQTVNKITRKGFESIITHALRYIKGSGHEFRLEFSKRGTYQELDFNTISPECQTPFDPTHKDAGGVLDILSLAVRVAILELYKPRIEGFLALDEPFRNLTKPKQCLENASKFIVTLKEKFGRQIIMVTQKEEFSRNADNVIDLNSREEERQVDSKKTKEEEK